MVDLSSNDVNEIILVDEYVEQDSFTLDTEGCADETKNRAYVERCIQFYGLVIMCLFIRRQGTSSPRHCVPTTIKFLIRFSVHFCFRIPLSNSSQSGFQCIFASEFFEDTTVGPPHPLPTQFLFVIQCHLLEKLSLSIKCSVYLNFLSFLFIRSNKSIHIKDIKDSIHRQSSDGRYCMSLQLIRPEEICYQI